MIARGLVRFVVVLRRGAGREVKPEAEALNGREFLFRFGWTIEDDDSRYPSEEAWIAEDPAYPNDAPMWIARGDLREVPR